MTIALFPFLAFIFMFGYVISVFGEQNQRKNKKHQENILPKIQNLAHNLEMGLMDKLEDQKITTDQDKEYS